MAKGLYRNDSILCEMIPEFEFALSPKKIKKTDIDDFAHLTGDRNRIHLDENFAKNTEYRKPIAHGMLTLSFLIGLIYESAVFEEYLLIFYGIDRLRFLSPTYIGDLLQGRFKIIKSRTTEKGELVDIELICDNEKGKRLIIAVVKFLLVKLKKEDGEVEG